MRSGCSWNILTWWTLQRPIQDFIHIPTRHVFCPFSYRSFNVNVTPAMTTTQALHIKCQTGLAIGMELLLGKALQTVGDCIHQAHLLVSKRHLSEISAHTCCYVQCSVSALNQSEHNSVTKIHIPKLCGLLTMLTIDHKYNVQQRNINYPICGFSYVS